MTVESQEQAARMALRTPCCGARFSIDYVYEGLPYMQEQVVDGFECTGEGCDNSWYADGSPSMIRSTTADESGYREAHFYEQGSS